MEELRNNIVSVVKQSAVVQRPGTETLKPREILDAIHEDVGDKLMSHLSDRVWEIVRSEDGMKTEIKETVQSVYTRVMNSKREEEKVSTTHQNPVSTFKEAGNNSSTAGLIADSDEIQHEKGVKELPGFSLHEHDQDSCEKRYTEKSQLRTVRGKSSKAEQRAVYQEPKKLDTDVVVHKPALSTQRKRRRAGDSNNEDPDVPPGFG